MFQRLTPFCTYAKNSPGYETGTGVPQSRGQRFPRPHKSNWNARVSRFVKKVNAKMQNKICLSLPKSLSFSVIDWNLNTFCFVWIAGFCALWMSTFSLNMVTFFQMIHLLSQKSKSFNSGGVKGKYIFKLMNITYTYITRWLWLVEPLI